MPPKQVSRRHMLTSLGAAALTLTHPACATLPDLSNPKARLRAFMMMRGALNEQLIISCIECTYAGIVNAQLTPFYNLVAATFSRSRPAPGGGYDVVSFEIEYFLDSASGDVLTAWRNPYTGETVQAKHTDSVPRKYRIGPDCQIKLPAAPLTPGTSISAETLPLRIIGNDVWSTEATTAIVPTPGGKPIRYNEKVINHARLSDIANPALVHAPTDVTYIGISSFRPWQNMGDHPGEMLGTGHGAVGITLAQLPAAWLAATSARHPEALRNPAAALDPLWRTLSP
jgi:hypothetical protein